MTQSCIAFKITIEGKEFDAFLPETSLEEALKLIKMNKKHTGYELVEHNNDYYTVSDEGIVATNIFCGGFGVSCYDVANYYSDKTVAENNARADRLMRQLRRFSVEHREDEMNWGSEHTLKYFIFYHYEHSKLLVNYNYNERPFGVIYFRSRESAELAIKTFHDELIWYFTEYKDSL